MLDDKGSYVDVDGIKTHYHDEGGGTPVLLLHGSGPGVSAWANWNRTIEALSDRFRVIAPDNVGFGQTEPREDQRYGVRPWVEHVLGFLDALGLDKVNFVGNSMGGRISLTVAAGHPERIDKLILMGALGTRVPPSDGLLAVRAYQPGFENMRDMIRTYFTYDESFAPDELAQRRYDASIAPGVQERYARMFADSQNNALTVTEDDLRGIPHETLILHGREDLVIPFANGLRLFELLPNAQLHGFSRCGHWVQVEHAAEFNRLVGDFISK
jgi:pimeloyl-ACP methyl ester carboxylesterase